MQGQAGDIIFQKQNSTSKSPLIKTPYSLEKFNKNQQVKKNPIHKRPSESLLHINNHATRKSKSGHFTRELKTKFLEEPSLFLWLWTSFVPSGFKSGFDGLQ